MPLKRLSLLFALALATPAALAQPKDDDTDDEEDDDDEKPEKEKAEKAPKAKKAEKQKKQKKKARDISLGGRVFVRDTITKLSSDGSQFQNRFGLESVRANIDLRKFGWLRASIEVSFEEDGEIDLEDVYAQIKLAKPLVIRAGRFKRPISPIALESAWSLPIIERGLLSDNVVIGDFSVPLNLGGRSEGVMASARSRSGVRPEVHVGLFNARLPNRAGGGAEIADLGDNLLRDLYSRVAIEPIEGFAVGASVAVVTRARTVARLKSGVTGSLDLSVKTRRFRAWLEAFGGRTTMFDGAEATGSLLALRLLLAPRFDKPIEHIRRLEPFVIFSALDPTDKSDNNRALEFGVGIAVWFRKVLRLQADFTYNAYDEQFPSENFTFIDRSTIRLQLGSQFR